MMTGSNPTISIVIPTRNRPIAIKRALQSVIPEICGRDIDIIVSNDGSDLPYPDLVNMFGCTVRCISSDKPLGVSAARNLAISEAMGDWILFLDDDDEIYPGYIDRVISRINDGRENMIFWSGVEIVNDLLDKEYSKTDRGLKSDFANREHLIQTYLSSGASFGVVVNRCVFDKVGLFDTSYCVGEDTDFFIRTLIEGFTPEPIEGIGVIKHEENSNRLSFNFKAYSENRIYERILDAYESLFFAKNTCNYVHLMLWAYRVHYRCGNRIAAENMIRRLELIGIPCTYVKYADLDTLSIPQINKDVKIFLSNFKDKLVENKLGVPTWI